jgi:hypothetical protein
MSKNKQYFWIAFTLSSILILCLYIIGLNAIDSKTDIFWKIAAGIVIEWYVFKFWAKKFF